MAKTKRARKSAVSRVVKSGFDLVPTNAPALRLLWARQRIDSLLAGGSSAEAISLAKEHNLICEGAAFIAWDELEKVPVSTREIYQPAMKPRFFAMRRASHSMTMGAASPTRLPRLAMRV